MLLRAAPLLLLLTLAVRAHGAPIPPGMEGEVQRLVGGGPLDGGWSIEDVRITADAIEVSLRGPAGTARVALRSPDAQGGGEPIGRTPSFRAVLVEGGDVARGVADGLVARVRERDRGTFFGEVERKAAPDTVPSRDEAAEARRFGPLDDARRALVWAALAATLVALAIRAWPRREPRTLAAVLALAVLALAVRFTIPTHAPIHANSHGIAELRGLAGSGAQFHGASESDRYGAAYRQVVRAVVGPFGGGARAALGFGALAGALAVVPLFLAASRLLRSRTAGLVAAGAFALHPAHVAVSPTESPQALATTLFLVGVASGLAAFDASRDERTRVLSIWAAALSTAAACELAVTTLALPLTALALVATGGSPPRRPAQVAAAAGVVLLAAGAHLAALGPVLAQASSARGELFAFDPGQLLGDRNLLLDASLTSPTLLPIALAGAIALALRRRARALVGIAAAIALLVPGAFLVTAAWTDALRYQATLPVPFFVLAGAVVLLVPDRWGARGLAAGAVLAASALAVPSAFALPALATPPFEAAGPAFVAGTADRIPAGALIVLPPRRMGRIVSDFPEFLLPESGASVRFAFEREDTPRACFVWVGPSCWQFTREEVATGAPGRAPAFADRPIRPECAALVEGVAPDAREAFARSVDVPRREREFFPVPADRPLVGLFPCAGQR